MFRTILHFNIPILVPFSPYILDALLDHPDVEIDSRTVEGYTSLYIACNKKKPNIKAIKKLLMHGADPNISDMEQVTPLHLACKFGDIKLLDLLLLYDANINCKDFNSYTPLHYCIEYKKEDLLENLLLAEADANIPNLHGLNPLMFGIVNKCDFTHLLVEFTENLDEKTKDHLTALQLAIKQNDSGLVASLIRNGADIYLAENASKPLMQALKEYKYYIFRMIWLELDLKRLKKYDEIFRNVLIACNASRDYRYMHLILRDERLVCDFSGQKGVLAFIFYKGTNLNSQYTELYFEKQKTLYENLFACLIRQGIFMSSADVESFIFYFYTCSYRIKLLKSLLDATRPDITEHLVIYAFEYDLKMGALLLTHCLDLCPANLFDQFRVMSLWHVDIWFILEHVLKYFTPSKNHRVKLIEKLLIANENPQSMGVFKLLDNRNVKSLKELSRDAVREQLQEVCDTSGDFLDMVEQLEVPAVIKEYIRLKLTVRSA